MKDNLNHKVLRDFVLPEELKHLPVYNWDDDQDEDEWIEMGANGGIWHMIGSRFNGKKIN